MVGGAVAAGTYDNELLDAHYIAGDGRVNENIGLTAVHHVFHSEHNRLVDHIKDVILAVRRRGLPQPVAADAASPRSRPTRRPWCGTASGCSRRPSSAPRCSTSTWCSRSSPAPSSRKSTPSSTSTTRSTRPSSAEFAHTVYRFGHSMLTETIDRLDPNFVSSEIGLIQAFLNPLAFAASGPTPEQAAGAIVRGMTRQVGNEIDEFVTEALRNNLLGLPLDLPAINMARGRDTGIPSLNAARRDFYAGDRRQPAQALHELGRFVAAHEAPGIAGQLHRRLRHASDRSPARPRWPASAPRRRCWCSAGPASPADRLDFLNSTGAWASGPDGVTTTGLDDVDFWVGGLAEKKMPFGGLLGSTFNFVFETQLEALQNGDRFYYLHRTRGHQLPHRAGEQLVRQAGHGQHRRDAPAGARLPDAGLHPRGGPDASSSTRRRRRAGRRSVRHGGRSPAIADPSATPS